MQAVHKRVTDFGAIRTNEFTVSERLFVELVVWMIRRVFAFIPR